MAITYTWTVQNMSVLQTPQPDFVVNAGWNCVGVDSDDATKTAALEGSQTFPDVQGDEFTPYASLTESEVLDWIWESMGPNSKESTEASIAGSINAQINPPVIPTTEPLPW